MNCLCHCFHSNALIVVTVAIAIVVLVCCYCSYWCQCYYCYGRNWFWPCFVSLGGIRLMSKHQCFAAYMHPWRTHQDPHILHFRPFPCPSGVCIVKTRSTKCCVFPLRLLNTKLPTQSKGNIMWLKIPARAFQQKRSVADHFGTGRHVWKNRMWLKTWVCTPNRLYMQNVKFKQDDDKGHRKDRLVRKFWICMTNVVSSDLYGAINMMLQHWFCLRLHICLLRTIHAQNLVYLKSCVSSLRSWPFG